MRKSIVLITAAPFCLALVLLPKTAAAAAMKDVLAACDKTPGCEYSSTKDGSISGCTGNSSTTGPKGSGVCFTCDPPGTKNPQCTATRQLPNGRFQAVKG